MKKTTKIISLVLSCILLIASMSFTVFAENSKNVYMYDIYQGYRCRAYARYDNYFQQAHGITHIVWNDNTAQTICVEAKTYIIVEYTDGSVSLGEFTSGVTTLSSYGEGALSNLSVDFTAGKTVLEIKTDHVYYQDGSIVHIEYVDLIAGKDF